jgi:hypothetical protein
MACIGGGGTNDGYGGVPAYDTVWSGLVWYEREDLSGKWRGDKDNDDGNNDDGNNDDDGFSSRDSIGTTQWIDGRVQSHHHARHRSPFDLFFPLDKLSPIQGDYRVPQVKDDKDDNEGDERRKTKDEGRRTKDPPCFYPHSCTIVYSYRTPSQPRLSSLILLATVVANGET